MTEAPAGWYPQGDGRQRYWDGAKWTEHFAPGAGESAALGGVAQSPANRTEESAAAQTAPMPFTDAIVGVGVPTTSGPPAAAADTRPWFKKKRVLIPSGLLALIVAGTALSSGDDDPGLAAAGATSTPTTSSSSAATTTAEPTTAAPSATPTATKPPAAPKPKPVTFSGDGIYEVGKDVKPGLYRSVGGDGYWERLKDASGEFDSIIANENPSGQAYVQIKKSDGYFSTNGMEDWVLVDLGDKGAMATKFEGDGMYLVGVDIKPGTYKARGDGYWERLKSASGEFGAIIANDNPSGNAIVKIKSTDKFFSTNGMGQWTRTG